MPSPARNGICRLIDLFLQQGTTIKYLSLYVFIGAFKVYTEALEHAYVLSSCLYSINNSWSSDELSRRSLGKVTTARSASFCLYSYRTVLLKVQTSWSCRFRALRSTTTHSNRCTLWYYYYSVAFTVAIRSIHQCFQRAIEVRCPATNNHDNVPNIHIPSTGC